MLQSAWQAESNGFGFAFRKVCNIPICFPLLFMCQHGVEFNVGLMDFDVPDHYPVYLTWHPNNLDYIQYAYAKKVMLVCNPISAYFRVKYGKRKPSDEGTVHYFSHSGPGFSHQSDHLENTLLELSRLPAHYHPISVCFHKSDYTASTVAKCDGYGFRAFTNFTGGTNEFVTNLIENSLKHRFVSGPLNQSAVLYAIDFGLDWIGPSGDHLDMKWNNVDNLEYMSDPYHPALVAVATNYLRLCSGQAKLRAMVRSHLGVHHYGGRAIYAFRIWSTYFNVGVLRVVLRFMFSKRDVHKFDK